MEFGTGVTTPTQWLDSRGVSTLTGRMTPPRQPGDPGVALHHLAVGEDLGAADVEGAVDLRRHERRRRRGSAARRGWRSAGSGPHPARGDHDGQALGEVPEHLERRRPRARGSPRPGAPSSARRWRAGSPRPPCATAGAARGPRRRGRGRRGRRSGATPASRAACGEGQRGPAVGPGERRGRCRGVQQVVGDVDAVQRRADLATSDASPSTTSIREPGPVAQPARVPGDGRGRGSRRRAAPGPAGRRCTP